MLGKFGTSKGFAFGKKNQEPPAPPVKLSEDQKVDDIDDQDARKLFFEAFNKVYSSESDKPKGFIATKKENAETEKESQGKSADSNNQLENDINEIKESVKSMMFGKLMTAAHQVDSGKEIVEDIKNDLEKSKSDRQNAQSVKVTPTPFIERYVEKVVQKSTDLTESLSSYESRFSSNDSFDTEEEMMNFLADQYDAVIRTSTRVANLEKAAGDVRSLSMKQLKITSNQLNALEKDKETETTTTNLSQIKSKYDQFLNEQKKKNEKKTEDTDLFGISLANATEEKKVGFGLNKSSTFGSGASKLGAISGASKSGTGSGTSNSGTGSTNKSAGPGT